MNDYMICLIKQMNTTTNPMTGEAVPVFFATKVVNVAETEKDAVELFEKNSSTRSDTSIGLYERVEGNTWKLVDYK